MDMPSQLLVRKANSNYFGAGQVDRHGYSPLLKRMESMPD